MHSVCQGQLHCQYSLYHTQAKLTKTSKPCLAEICKMAAFQFFAILFLLAPATKFSEAKSTVSMSQLDYHNNISINMGGSLISSEKLFLGCMILGPTLIPKDYLFL